MAAWERCLRLSVTTRDRGPRVSETQLGRLISRCCSKLREMGSHDPSPAPLSRFPPMLEGAEQPADAQLDSVLTKESMACPSNSTRSRSSTPCWQGSSLARYTPSWPRGSV